jgi:hypothetical protein
MYHVRSAFRVRVRLCVIMAVAFRMSMRVVVRASSEPSRKERWNSSRGSLHLSDRLVSSESSNWRTDAVLTFLWSWSQSQSYVAHLTIWSHSIHRRSRSRCFKNQLRGGSFWLGRNAGATWTRFEPTAPPGQIIRVSCSFRHSRGLCDV